MPTVDSTYDLLPYLSKLNRDDLVVFHVDKVIILDRTTPVDSDLPPHVAEQKYWQAQRELTSINITPDIDHQVNYLKNRHVKVLFTTNRSYYAIGDLTINHMASAKMISEGGIAATEHANHDYDLVLKNDIIFVNGPHKIEDGVKFALNKLSISPKRIVYVSPDPCESATWTNLVLRNN